MADVKGHTVPPHERELTDEEIKELYNEGKPLVCFKKKEEKER